ncbi:ATPase [endosymbiont of Lamellibrachia barhami]|uniref:ATPase n=1 Tax=endosymbiont of Lamellibrachia barhami TaxID=205975 RepID=UPI0015A82297|nr:ATPase [endosymbiont of Lamellibrachia barhami]
MDENLQRLLDAEMQAEQLHQQANEERERIIHDALQEVRAQETRFETRIPELHASFLDKANSRSDQTIAELKRRFDEHHTQLREYAETREDDALDAAFQLLTDPAADD